MSRHHIATHAYDFRTGWVRISPTTMTPEQAAALRDRGFTIVRSRRGWFGTRELPLSWYLRGATPGVRQSVREPVKPAESSPQGPNTSDADAPSPMRSPTRRARPRSRDTDA
jgi:hypothetical protein